MQHFRVLRDPGHGGQYHIWNHRFPSLNALIDYHRKNSIGQAEEPPLLLKDLEMNLRCHALYDFTAQDERDLSFRARDVISVVDMPDTNWWLGRNANGEEGLFPATYVEIM